ALAGGVMAALKIRDDPGDQLGKLRSPSVFRPVDRRMAREQPAKIVGPVRTQSDCVERGGRRGRREQRLNGRHGRDKAALRVVVETLQQGADLLLRAPVEGCERFTAAI